ncbi:hypothetical protein ES703_28183 [subsurface metagenome]
MVEDSGCRGGVDRTTGVKEVLPFDKSFQPRARGMGAIESIVWDTWWHQNRNNYERFGQNVPVWVDGVPEESRTGALDAKLDLFGCYRVDAIAGVDGNVEIIEVKETGNLTAIGQLIVYRMLYLRTYWGFSTLTLRLVCLRAPPAIQFACRELGIEISEVGEAAAHQVKLVRQGKL